jgi:hypothetical protein
MAVNHLIWARRVCGRGGLCFPYSLAAISAVGFIAYLLFLIQLNTHTASNSGPYWNEAYLSILVDQRL